MTLQKDPERTEIKTLNQFIDFSGRRALEIGCGDGRLTWRYGRQAAHVTGIDLDGSGLRFASIDRPSDLQGRVEFAQADATHLPFGRGTFDLAIFAWSF
jgi:ubiquinone/menaquinone biosynthesis C-methylase UbiE